MAADDDGDDLVAGVTNHCESGTELIAGNDEIGSHNKYVLRVAPSSSLDSSDGNNDAIVGLEGEGFGGHGVGVHGTGNTGVYGSGSRETGGKSTGVGGEGDVGVEGTGQAVGAWGRGPIGVRGEGQSRGDTAQRARFVGGEFSGEIQLHLVVTNVVASKTTTPTAPREHVIAGRPLYALAEAGSLLAATVGGECALWLCVRSGTDKKHPAQWRQVLLGETLIEGGA
jgi:hypothetical protein